MHDIGEQKAKVYRHEIPTGHGLEKAHCGPVDEVTILLTIGIEIADAPDVIHAAGILHR